MCNFSWNIGFGRRKPCWKCRENGYHLEKWTHETAFWCCNDCKRKRITKCYCYQRNQRYGDKIFYKVLFFQERDSLVAQTIKRLPTMQETRVWSPGREDPPGEGHGNPLQYSCLENPTDWGAWWATVHGVAKSRTWLSNFTSFILIGKAQNANGIFSGRWVPLKLLTGLLLTKSLALPSTLPGLSK